MANHDFFKFLHNLNPEMVLIAGSFTTDGSGDASVISCKGVSSIARAGGTYTVTMQESYQGVYFGLMGEANGTPETPSAVSINDSTPTVAFALSAAKTSTTVYLVLLLKNSEVG